MSCILFSRNVIVLWIEMSSGRLKFNLILPNFPDLSETSVSRIGRSNKTVLAFLGSSQCFLRTCKRFDISIQSSAFRSGICKHMLMAPAGIWQVIDITEYWILQIILWQPWILNFLQRCQLHFKPGFMAEFQRESPYKEVVMWEILIRLCYTWKSKKMKICRKSRHILLANFNTIVWISRNSAGFVWDFSNDRA